MKPKPVTDSVSGRKLKLTKNGAPMRKVSIIVGVADDRVVPADVLSGICEALRDFRGLRLEFVVIRQAPGTAVNMVSGDFVVMFDVDGCDPADVKKVLLPLLEDRADVVLGNPLGRLSGSVTLTCERAANSFLIWVANQLFKLNIGDSQTGLRAFRREALGVRLPVLRFEEVDISYRRGEC